MSILKEAKQKRRTADDPMSPVKEGSDALKEALKRLARHGTKDSYSAADVLKVDNEVRKEYGLRQLVSYPIQEKEYDPTTRNVVWHQFTGAKVVKETGKLPTLKGIWVEAEGVDPIDILPEIEAQADKECERLFPIGHTIPKEHRAAIVESIVQRMQVEAMGEDPATPRPKPSAVDLPSDDEDKEDAEPKAAPKPKPAKGKGK